ncbi:MAG: NAD(+) synthase [Betaproteobacteria bacterium]|nr:NAD(+) synthase [Betaproteobacteria bacterium]
MSSADAFINLYRHGFVRVAVAVPDVRVADPAFNAAQSLALLREAAARHAILAVFPELGLSAYSCDDLFHQQALLDAAQAALRGLLDATRSLPLVAVLGMPLRVDSLLYNCAVVVHRGHILGAVPKTYLPNYREFYELRQFTPGDTAGFQRITLCGQPGIPFASELIFRAENLPAFRFAIEICEDLWTPIPPSSLAALAGATVLVNLSASNITIGKEDYRRQLAANQSARAIAAYVYSAAGPGESTTDLAWDGHGMIHENGSCLAETQRFADHPQLLTADVDLERLEADRMRQNSFGQARARHRAALERFQAVPFVLDIPAGRLPLQRAYERFPYVPSDAASRDRRCREVYAIQVQGLVKRMRSAGIERVVIGVSGGLDSTQALLVCAKAMDAMGLPRSNILAYTLPGFATGERTLDQARRLIRLIGAHAGEIDVRPSCMQMFRDIGHPFANGEGVHDLTFENVQAGERTSHLFRLANLHGALVVGTSDLTELALGWCTYGVGDHMSHYSLNASVPKTLVQYLIRWAARTHQFGEALSPLLEAVAATEISPELIPGDHGGQPGQRSEEIVGPYELQDFHLYYILRFGYAPSKVAFLAWSAWHDEDAGRWPDMAGALCHRYDIGTIKRWLGVFLRRFFQTSQYKRSCVPNSPKVGSGGSLSPRGDYRAPSDGEAAAWLSDLERIPDRVDAGG